MECSVKAGDSAVMNSPDARGRGAGVFFYTIAHNKEDREHFYAPGRSYTYLLSLEGIPILGLEHIYILGEDEARICLARIFSLNTECLPFFQEMEDAS